MTLASAITFPAKAMTASERKKLALQAISKQKSLSDVANDNQVSRKFIYSQKNKMLDVINQVFNDDKVSSNDEVLVSVQVPFMLQQPNYVFRVE